MSALDGLGEDVLVLACVCCMDVKAGSGMNRVHVVLSELSMRLLDFAQTWMCAGMFLDVNFCLLQRCRLYIMIVVFVSASFFYV